MNLPDVSKETWYEVLRPTFSDTKGHALFVEALEVLVTGLMSYTSKAKQIKIGNHLNIQL